MDIEQIYRDFSIDYVTEGHKHARDGWCNCPCPFCTTDHPGYHLGYNLTSNSFTCWKCGYHPVTETLSLLLHIPYSEAKHVAKEYGMLIFREKKESKLPERIDHKLPSGTMPLGINHIRYLQKRSFDYEKLIDTFHILGTGPIATLTNGTKKLDYSHRIVIPFIWDDRQVSFDTRDITGNAIAKYMACPLERELIPHKSILYGRQDLWGDQIICVEGPTDVWRFGHNSCATSGIKYTPKQMRLLCKFKRVFVCFDGGEQQAMIQAKQLVADIRFHGKEAHFVWLDSGDPGSMSQFAADKFVHKLLNY